MESSLVQVKETILITPSSQTPTQILSLSSLDSQLFLRFTFDYLFIYHPQHSRSPTSTNERDAFTARLKAALAEALVPYYPLAGRVRASSQNSSSSNLEVVCEAQGAAFVEAISDISISEFQRAPTHSTEWKNLLSLQVDDVLSGSPPLVVQLTWLADGAAAVGVRISHCICDGTGSVEFLNLFAELASGTRRGLSDLKPNPVWDRHLLNHSNEKSMISARSVVHPEFKQVEDLCGFMSRFAREPLSPTSVTFDLKSLNELKKLACLTSPQGELVKYTSFEVLSAHVWRCWAMSLELPPAQTLRLLFSVDVRNRVKPNLPDGFYGNGFVLGCAQTSVGELMEKGLGWASWLVREAKERVGDEYVRSVVEQVSSESNACPDLVGVLIMTQWSRLGLEKLDFGMGKPVHVGPVIVKNCRFLPVPEQREAVKVMVSLPKSAVGKYEYLINEPAAIRAVQKWAEPPKPNQTKPNHAVFNRTNRAFGLARF